MREHRFQGIVFQGNSEGGIQTSIVLPQYKLMFDIGRGYPETIEIPRIFLTHGHLDHSAGIPYHLSQRSLRQLSPAEVYCPAPMADPLDQILKLWHQIEGFETKYRLTGVSAGDHFQLKGNTWITAVPSFHRVPSNGYLVYEKTAKLRPEFAHLSGPEIARLKQEQDLFYTQDKALIAFSGDTTIEFVINNPAVQQARILFLECTYVCDKRPVDRARQWGHTHLHEIAAHADLFRSVERLFLIHFSARYRRGEIEAALQRELPDWLHARTVIW
ncbi:MAG: MBL fold metallo-hydrolase [Leptospiraceae bacterium]|nr:MBL fold metallo-hydrolase [Leptospiraceae bacterium]